MPDTLTDLREARVAELVKECATLRAALLSTREGEDRQDGRPCWCPSPTFPAAHAGQHSTHCAQCRAALEGEK